MCCVLACVCGARGGREQSEGLRRSRELNVLLHLPFFEFQDLMQPSQF